MQGGLGWHQHTHDDSSHSLSSMLQVDSKESPSVAMLVDVAKSLGVLLVGGSIPEKDQGGKIYNTCVIVGPGKLVSSFFV